jgi:hypothetical protein
MIEPFYVYMLWAIGNTMGGGGVRVGIVSKERNGYNGLSGREGVVVFWILDSSCDECV